MTDSRPWRDKDILEELYVEKELSSRDVADELNCGQSTVLRWLRRHDIDRRREGRRQIDLPEPLDNPDELRRLYRTEQLSTNEIAEKYGVTRQVVRARLKRFGIEMRSHSTATVLRGIKEGKNFGYHITSNGYESFRSFDGGDRVVFHVHQLVAIANGADPHKIFSGGSYHVHHKNGCTFDNRPSNLEVLSAKDHREKHH